MSFISRNSEFYSSKEIIKKTVICDGDFLEYLKKALEQSYKVIYVLERLDFYAECVSKINDISEEVILFKSRSENLQEVYKEWQGWEYTTSFESIYSKLIFCKEILTAVISFFTDYDLITEIEKQFTEKVNIIENNTLQHIQFFHVDDICVCNQFLNKGIDLDIGSFKEFKAMDKNLLRREEDILSYISRCTSIFNDIKEQFLLVEKSNNPAEQKYGKDHLLSNLQAFFESHPTPEEIENFLHEDAPIMLKAQVERYREKISPLLNAIETELETIPTHEHAIIRKSIIWTSETLKNQFLEAETNPLKALQDLDFIINFSRWTEYIEIIKNIYSIAHSKDTNEFERTKASTELIQITRTHYLSDRVSRKDWEEFKAFLEQENIFTYKTPFEIIIHEIEHELYCLKNINNFDIVSQKAWEEYGKDTISKVQQIQNNAEQLFEQFKNKDSNYNYNLKQFKNIKRNYESNNIELPEEDIQLLSKAEYRKQKHKKVLQNVLNEIQEKIPSGQKEWKEEYRQILLTSRSSNLEQEVSKFPIQNCDEKTKEAQEYITWLTQSLEDRIHFYNNLLKQEI